MTKKKHRAKVVTKNCTLQVRATKSEVKLWRKAAAKDRITLSEWMRRQADSATTPIPRLSAEEMRVLNDPRSFDYSQRPFDVVELESVHKLEHEAEMAEAEAKMKRDAGIGAREFASGVTS